MIISRLDRAEKKNGIFLILVDGAELIGIAEAFPRRFAGMTHCAELDICIRRSHREPAACRLLLDEMIDRCDVMGMWRIELCLIPGNDLLTRRPAMPG